MVSPGSTLVASAGSGSLLLAVPATIVLRFAGARPIWLFVASGLAIIPLAGLMGEATEQLAERLGPGIGGLLNATFGNAAELIIALFALFKGYDEVVKASLTGSILGNVLLVLGASLLAGGLKHRTQTFNRTAAGVGATMLVLAAFGLLVPAIFHELPEVTAARHRPGARAEHRRLGDPDARPTWPIWSSAWSRTRACSIPRTTDLHDERGTLEQPRPRPPS